MNQRTESFKYEHTWIELVQESLKRGIFKRITARSLNLFLRGGDLISITPQILGVHEPELTSLISKLADGGYGDFLIDIGANIGLTSCQSGKKFNEVHMYEPNPLCCHILQVNSTISLDCAKFFINPVGLGDVDKSARLTIPKHNWGGAFVADATNSYDRGLLTQKDGLQQVDAGKYFEVDIKILNTRAEMARLFSELKGKGLKSGVIKIDVEGYETAVLAGIAEAIPDDIEVYILFESWDANFDLSSLIRAFRGRATPMRLIRRAPYGRNWPTIIKALAALFRWRFSTALENIETGCVGDIILSIRSVEKCTV